MLKIFDLVLQIDAIHYYYVLQIVLKYIHIQYILNTYCVDLFKYYFWPVSGFGGSGNAAGKSGRK